MRTGGEPEEEEIGELAKRFGDDGADIGGEAGGIYEFAGEENIEGEDCGADEGDQQGDEP